MERKSAVFASNFTAQKRSSFPKNPSMRVNPLCYAQFFQEETVFAMELVLSEAKAKRLKQSQRQFLSRRSLPTQTHSYFSFFSRS
jgi:hypothetical protein